MSFFWNATATGNAIVEDCVITRNVAQVEGGGLMLTTEAGITPDWLLVGNTTLCNNTPENTNPNAAAPFVDLGGNQICGCPGDINFDAASRRTGPRSASFQLGCLHLRRSDRMLRRHQR